MFLVVFFNALFLRCSGVFFFFFFFFFFFRFVLATKKLIRVFWNDTWCEVKVNETVIDEPWFAFRKLGQGAAWDAYKSNSVFTCNPNLLIDGFPGSSFSGGLVSGSFPYSDSVLSSYPSSNLPRPVNRSKSWTSRSTSSGRAEIPAAGTSRSCADSQSLCRALGNDVLGNRHFAVRYTPNFAINVRFFAVDFVHTAVKKLTINMKYGYYTELDADFDAGRLGELPFEPSVRAELPVVTCRVVPLCRCGGTKNCYCCDGLQVQESVQVCTYTSSTM